MTCLLLSGCQSQVAVAPLPVTQVAPNSDLPPATAAPIPERPRYSPGDLVDYLAQTGDTLPVLAAHFNTTVAEILKANPIIPANATTLPPGMPMKIPIYYTLFWGSQYQVLPDSLFINGPAQVSFRAEEFVTRSTGWLNGYVEYASGANRSGAQVVDLVALNFSVSPQMLLALLEYQSGALTQPIATNPTLNSIDIKDYPLGHVDESYQGLYMQLVWSANILNNGYYGWRTGRLASFEHLDGRLERPDPWQNSASVASQYFFSRLVDKDDYDRAIGPEGFAQAYRLLFGDPWQSNQPYIPGSLVQPPLMLPFPVGKAWTLTGGPHTAWGEGDPLSALDFAPPAVTGGCSPTTEWSTAVAPGVVVRSEPAIVVLDLDGDRDEHTGWVIFYLHVATEGRAPVGMVLKAGDPIGHPSCEGGKATGTHVHIARKYNGEWIPAEGSLAFDLEGWIAHNGARPYLGSLTRYSRTVTACECSDHNSQVVAGEK